MNFDLLFDLYKKTCKRYKRCYYDFERLMSIQNYSGIESRVTNKMQRNTFINILCRTFNILCYHKRIEKSRFISIPFFIEIV